MAVRRHRRQQHMRQIRGSSLGTGRLLQTEARGRHGDSTDPLHCFWTTASVPVVAVPCRAPRHWKGPRAVGGGQGGMQSGSERLLSVPKCHQQGHLDKGRERHSCCWGTPLSRASKNWAVHAPRRHTPRPRMGVVQRAHSQNGNWRPILGPETLPPPPPLFGGV